MVCQGTDCVTDGADRDRSVVHAGGLMIVKEQIVIAGDGP